MAADFGIESSDDIERVKRWIANARRFLWMYPLFGLLAAVPELVGSRRTTVFLVVGFLVIAPIFAAIRQRLRPSSLNALIDMSAMMIVGFSTLMLLGIWNIFYRQATFTIVHDYWPVYGFVAVGTCFLAFRYARDRWRPSVSWLQQRVNRRQVDIKALAHFWYGHPSLEGNKKNMPYIKMVAFGAALATLAISGIGGRQYLFALLGLAGIPIFLPPMISILTKYWYFRRALGRQDIQISELAL